MYEIPGERDDCSDKFTPDTPFRCFATMPTEWATLGFYQVPGVIT